MSGELTEYLTSKVKKIDGMFKPPIVCSWIGTASMKECISILDRKVTKLINLKANKKLEEWFLSGDASFNSITAERYLLDYLSIKNCELREILQGGDVDAELETANGILGIEVTTLARFIGDWIMTERLRIRLDQAHLLENRRFEIQLDTNRLSSVTEQELDCFVEDVYNAIAGSDGTAGSGNGFEFRENNGYGTISWMYSSEEKPLDYQYFIDCITTKTLGKLIDKGEQLSKRKRNVVFIGMNHAMPSFHEPPTFFEELAGTPRSHKELIKHIHNFWRQQMPSRIIGVCYFQYSLCQETPFYQLRFITRDNNEEIGLIC